MDEARAALHRLVRRAARRVTWQRALRGGLLAGTVVLAGLLAATLAGTIVPLDPISPVAAAAAALAAVAVVTVLLAAARPVDDLQASRLLDLRAGLEERASTALEVSLRGLRTALAPRLLADAARRAEAADLRQAFPWRPPRTAFAAAALLALLVVWPATLRGVALPGTPAHRTREAIRREGARLEQFARALAARTRAQRMPQTRRVAPEIRDLGTRLRQERIDRAEALARIGELSRRIEEARREIDGRLEAQRPQGAPPLAPDLLRRDALQQQIRQLRELTSRLRESPEAASREALQRLGEITREGEAGQPAQTRGRLEQARRQLERGDAAGAGESIAEALRELEGLEALLADQEGLRSARRELDRSQEAIAAAGSAPPEELVRDPSAAPEAGNAPGDERPAEEAGAEAVPPAGPHEGITAGQGRVREKLGRPSPRLEAPRVPERLRGTQAEGPVTSAEVQGAGRPGAVRVPLRDVAPAIAAEADRAMTAARTPGRYRALVRRYFERLARLR